MKKVELNIITIYVLLLVSTLSAQKKTEKWIESESLFQEAKSEHFIVRYIPDSSIVKNLNYLIEEREKGYQNISAFLNIKIQKKINIYFFPNEKEKYEITGHRGYGGGGNNTIVEVYNDSIQVDPYHELIHILVYEINKPPAMIDEGLAVYLAEKYGNNSLLSLIGFPKNTTDEVLQIISEKETLLKLSLLYRLQKISDSENVKMAYLQSASFVKYLVEKYGKENFLNFLTEIKKDDINHNLQVLIKVYGLSLETLEEKWLATLKINQ